MRTTATGVAAQPAALVPVTVYVQVNAEIVAGGAAVLDANVEVGIEVTVCKLFGVINNETCGYPAVPGLHDQE